MEILFKEYLQRTANMLQKTYVKTLQASFATGTLSAHCGQREKQII
jgi:hypothetical protein